LFKLFQELKKIEENWRKLSGISLEYEKKFMWWKSINESFIYWIITLIFSRRRIYSIIRIY
jgi:hypothetical protein